MKRARKQTYKLSTIATSVAKTDRRGEITAQWSVTPNAYLTYAYQGGRVTYALLKSQIEGVTCHTQPRQIAMHHFASLRSVNRGGERANLRTVDD